MNRKLSNLFNKFRYHRRKRDDKKQRSTSQDSLSSVPSPGSTRNFFRYQPPKKGSKKRSTCVDTDFETVTEDEELELALSFMRDLDYKFQMKKKRSWKFLCGDVISEEYAVVIQIIGLVVMDFNFCQDTLFFAVDMIKRYIYKLNRSVKVDEFVLISFTSLFIASKFEEVDHLFIDEILQLLKKYKYFSDIFDTRTAKSIQRRMNDNSIHKQEIEILTTLHFHPVNRASALWFVREFFHRKNELESADFRLCQFLLEALCFNFELIEFSNLNLANSIVYISEKLKELPKISSKKKKKKMKTKKEEELEFSEVNGFDDDESIEDGKKTKDEKKDGMQLVDEVCYERVLRCLHSFIQLDYNRHRIRKLYKKEKEFVSKGMLVLFSK